MKFEYSAGAVVYRHKDGKRQYLFLKSEEGWLGIPKGHIEEGETAEQAAIREIREEAGLDVELDMFFRDKFSYWFVFDKQKIHKDLTIFLSRVHGGPKVM
ncbi:MAG: NUDIX domain-containing protein, partial [Candidatus Micrarchaeaceae archaeon]